MTKYLRSAALPSSMLFLLGLHPACNMATIDSASGNAGGSMSGPYLSPQAAPPADTEGGDKYQAVGTNPFTVAAHDPWSTFAVDVDTASYDIFRRDVNDGVLPDPDSVRLEEYVNNFSYDYPAPAQGSEVPFSIALATSPHVLDRGTTLLRVGLQGQKPPPFEKKPANLVFLVDTSGSMSGSDKLPLVRYVLTRTLDVLAPTDTVAIVTYAGSTGVALSPTPVSERNAIAAKIETFTAGGSTNGAGGLELAYAQAQTGFIESGINHVILCTDGDFNVGVSSTDALVAMIEAKRKTGITLTVLGFGSGNLNDEMMEAISNKGNGVYGVISSQAQADRYVSERMLSTIVHIAKDVKIQVEFNPARVYAYRLLGYENRDIADQDFRNDVIDAGEIGAGHRVTALYEIVPSGGTVPAREGAPALVEGAAADGAAEVAPSDLVLVKIRYKSPDAAETDPAREVQASLPGDRITAQVAADRDTQWAVAIAAFAEILKGSPYAEPEAVTQIAAIVGTDATRDADRSEFATLLTKARSLLGM